MIVCYCFNNEYFVMYNLFIIEVIEVCFCNLINNICK